MPCLLFADDKILVAPEHQFQKLLDIVGEFAQQNKIEFSGPKSVVIPLHRPVIPGNKWDIGFVYNENGDKEKISMKEVEDGKYLGVHLQRTKNHYRIHMANAISKANSQIWPISRMIRGLGRGTQIAYKLLEIYSINRITYGLDIAEINAGLIKSLNVFQNKVARIAMNATPWTKKVVLHGEMNLPDFTLRIAKMKFNLLTYFQNLPDHRWARLALKQQDIWLKKDKLDPDWLIKKTPAYWLEGVAIIARDLGIPESLIFQKSWNNKEIREIMVRDYNIDKMKKVTGKDYMMYFRDKTIPRVDPDIYKYDDTIFWWEMKTGVLSEKYDDRFDFKNQQTQEERDQLIKIRLCTLCKELDCIEHCLWICEPVKIEFKKRKLKFIDHPDIERTQTTLSFVKDITNVNIHEGYLINLYLLNYDHSISFKKEVGRWIRETLNVRKALLKAIPL
jgi:hypothetical protein